MMRKNDKRVKVNRPINRTVMIRLQKKFKTDEEIGRQIGGITRQAVHQMRTKFGVPSLIVGNKDRNKRIRKLARSGECKLNLAKKFNMHHSSIYRICRGKQ